MAGVGDKPPPNEDTLRETPVAKTERASIPDDWKPPPRRKDVIQGSELARPGDLDLPTGGGQVPRQGLPRVVDVGFGAARVRSFQVKGPFALLAGLAIFAAIGVLCALVFVFAVGIGAALAVSAAALGVLGMGAAAVRRLTGGSRPAGNPTGRSPDRPRELEKRDGDR